MLNHSCTHIYLILQLHILNIIEVNLFISCKKNIYTTGRDMLQAWTARRNAAITNRQREH